MSKQWKTITLNTIKSYEEVFKTTMPGSSQGADREQQL